MPRTPRNRLASPSVSSPNRASAANGAAGGDGCGFQPGRAGCWRVDRLRCCGLSASVRPVVALGCVSRSDAGLAMLLRSILPLQQISTWQLGAFRVWFSLHDMRRPTCYVEHAGLRGFGRLLGPPWKRRSGRCFSAWTLSDAAEHDAQDDDDRRERDEQIASHELEPCAHGLPSSHLSLF